MEPVLTPEAMNEADRRTIAAGTPVDVLMDRAGRAVAWEVRRVTHGTYGQRVVLVCGKGNNGGDGLVAGARARGLGHADAACSSWPTGSTTSRSRVRWPTPTWPSTPCSAPGSAGRWRTTPRSSPGSWPRGTAPRSRSTSRRASTGSAAWSSGPPCAPTRTVTFAARKPGLVFEPGRSYSGEVVVADIGIDLGPGPHPGLVTDDDVRAWLPPRAPDAHKWRSGVMVVGGSGGMTGAPMFVSHAAMRAGAGIVWCGLPGDDAARAASGTEVITRPLPADPERRPGPRTRPSRCWRRSAGSARWPSVPVSDPTPEVGLAVRALVAEARAPLVLDADGLNALAGDFAAFDARRTLGAPAVLTPHAGEYERLMGRPVGDDRIEAACALAERSGAVVLLKGPGTVVAAPGGRVALNPTGGAELATAGSGDVLTGIVAGFLARGMAPFAAAAAAAWVHGATADRLVASDGPGLVASDLVRGLPRTLQALGVAA